MVEIVTNGYGFAKIGMAELRTGISNFTKDQNCNENQEISFHWASITKYREAVKSLVSASYYSLPMNREAYMPHIPILYRR